MLLSMTGYGESRGETEDCVCTVEIRSVNNRFLKVNTKVSESHQSLQDRLEKLIRGKLRRGSISLTVRLRLAQPETNYQINRKALEAYVAQLNEALGSAGSTVLAQVLSLPGVVEEAEARTDIERDWLLIEEQTQSAIAHLQEMRRAEGAAIRSELAQLQTEMSRLLAEIVSASSDTVSNYRIRLQERVNGMLAELGVTVNEGALVREVAIFAERCDIAEETSRLSSHLQQLASTLEETESPGRKLDFLIQEMYREANTIGSKANDARVSQIVVDLKGKIEQAREIVQNVE